MKSRGPLAVCSTANGHEGRSLYSEAFRKKQGEAPGGLVFGCGQVAEFRERKPPILARGANVRRSPGFLSMRVRSRFVTDAEGRFLGGVALRDIKLIRCEIELAKLVIAGDILR